MSEKLDQIREESKALQQVFNTVMDACCPVAHFMSKPEYKEINVALNGMFDAIAKRQMVLAYEITEQENLGAKIVQMSTEEWLSSPTKNPFKAANANPSQ